MCILGNIIEDFRFFYKNFIWPILSSYYHKHYHIFTHCIQQKHNTIFSIFIVFLIVLYHCNLSHNFHYINDLKKADGKINFISMKNVCHNQIWMKIRIKRNTIIFSWIYKPSWNYSFQMLFINIWMYYQLNFLMT